MELFIGTVIEVNLKHAANTSFPNDSIELGILIFVNGKTIIKYIILIGYYASES